MKVLELNLSDSTAAKLDELARRLRLTPQQLAVLSLEERFEELDGELQVDSQFETAADFVLEKNTELHRRLA